MIEVIPTRLKRASGYLIRNTTDLDVVTVGIMNRR